jgi:hypothetical protein
VPLRFLAFFIPEWAMEARRTVLIPMLAAPALVVTSKFERQICILYRIDGDDIVGC